MNYNEVVDHMTDMSDKEVNEFYLTVDGMVFNNFDWVRISQKGNLSNEFIDKYAKFIDWASLLSHQDVPMSLVHKHEDDINWTDVFSVSRWIPVNDSIGSKCMNEYRDLSHPDKDHHYSDEFFREFKNKIEWEEITYWQLVPVEYLLKHAVDIDWEDERVLKYQQLTVDAIEELIDRGYIDTHNIDAIIKYQPLNDDIVLRHKDVFTIINVENNAAKREYHYGLAANPGISEQFILDHAELATSALIRRHNNSDEFIHKCIEAADEYVSNASIIYYNDNISDVTIDEMLTKFADGFTKLINL